MSWRNINLIFQREVRDQLRDRRTLFMIAILPLLLYPALGIGMLQMTVTFSEQTRTVVVLGQKHLPPEPELVLESDKLEVIGDAPLSKSESRKPRAAALLTHAKEIRQKLSKLSEIEKTREQALEDKQTAVAKELAQTIGRLKAEIGRLFSASRMQVLIIVPDGFGENLLKMNKQIASRTATIAELVDYPRPMIVQNSADEKSLIAYRRVTEVLRVWEDEILKRRLAEADLPVSLTEPVKPNPIDLAQKEQIAATLWSKLFPALLVIMAVTGAFYPAIDLGAGEKERGTMETLLICPATRTEIVLGKFLTVMLFSMSTAVLNLISMGLTGRHMVSVAGRGAMARIGEMSFPSAESLCWVLIFLVPLAALFSALCLSLATFARSSKEGQYYLTPLLMVTLGLTVFCLSPAVEITPFYSVMPVMGVALLLKAMLLSPVNAGSLYLYAIPVLITSVGYSLLALWWAIDQFSREDVLFREAERFELGLWIRHLLRDKEPIPTFSEAGFCFVFIMLLQFAGIKYMSAALAGSAPDGSDTMMMRLLMIQQLVIIATPALFMGVMLTTSVVRTFRLRLPSLRILAAAMLLPLVLHPLSLELSASLQWFFPPLPASVTEALKGMANPRHPWWLVLLTFAVVPAICEEIAFRGFILSGFKRQGRAWLAIGLSSLMFGIMHMIPQQVFNAALLGLVLGLIAIRGNSLLPCILFHFIYNSLAVIHGRIDTAGIEGTWLNRFVTVGERGISYEWPTLVMAGGIAAVLLYWLVNRQPAEPSEVVESQPTTEPDELHKTGVAGKPPVRVS